AGRFMAAELNGAKMAPPPVDTAMGALLGHITGGAEADTYQPMNVNFGLFPPLDLKGRSKKADRKKLYSSRARAAFAEWASTQSSSPAAGAATSTAGSLAIGN
ncbi:MAG: hypothetical protein RLZZ366_1039, partial [Pseudomonadota bacterium]